MAHDTHAGSPDDDETPEQERLRERDEADARRIADHKAAEQRRLSDRDQERLRERDDADTRRIADHKAAEQRRLRDREQADQRRRRERDANDRTR